MSAASPRLIDGDQRGVDVTLQDASAQQARRNAPAGASAQGLAAATLAAADDFLSDADKLAIAGAQADVNGLRSRRTAIVASVPLLPDDSDALKKAKKRLAKKSKQKAAKLEQKAEAKKKKLSKKASLRVSEGQQALPQEGRKRKAAAPADDKEKRKRKARIDVTISLTDAGRDGAKKPRPSSKLPRGGKQQMTEQLEAYLSLASMDEPLQAAAPSGSSPLREMEAAVTHPASDERPATDDPPRRVQTCAPTEPLDPAVVTGGQSRRPGVVLSPPRRSPSPESAFPSGSALPGPDAEQQTLSLAGGSQGLLRDLEVGEASSSRATAARRSPFTYREQPTPSTQRRLPARRPEGWASVSQTQSV